MAVVVAERAGLHVALTRFASAGPLGAELRAASDQARSIEQAMLAASTAGSTYGAAMRACDRGYAAVGQAGAWREHYQGGPVGYRQREFEIVPSQTTSRWYRDPDRARPRARLESEPLGRRQGRGHLPRGGARPAPAHRLGQLATRRRPARGARRGKRRPGVRAEAALGRLGCPPPAAVADGGGRFPDGAALRIEIPSVEGPRVLEEVVSCAAREGITVNRVSQGSGAMLLREAELAAMAELGHEAGLEVSLFVGPREGFDVGAHGRSADGSAHFGQLRGARGLAYAVEDIARAVECGIRSFLVADVGLLEVVTDMQRIGELPADVIWKVSVMMAPSNPVSARMLERLGASTVNVPSDMTVAQLAELRSAISIPIDLYVESPDSLGGVVRGNELGDLVAAGAPLYAKFGLRNARALYPAGAHVLEDARAIAREKVHRAAVGLEWLARLRPELTQSSAGAPGLGIPVPAGRAAAAP